MPLVRFGEGSWIHEAFGSFLLLVALLLGGYFGIKHLYDSGLAPDTILSPLGFYILLLCNFLTGYGGFAGLTSSTNTTVMILRLISILSEHPQLVWLLRASDYRHSFSLVRPIPLPEPSAPQSLEDGDDVQEALLPAQPRYTTLLSDLNSIEDRSVRYTPIDINNSPILLEESWKSLVPLKHLARTLVRRMSTGKYFCTTLIFGYCLVSVLLSYSPSA